MIRLSQSEKSQTAPTVRGEIVDLYIFDFELRFFIDPKMLGFVSKYKLFHRTERL